MSSKMNFGTRSCRILNAQCQLYRSIHATKKSNAGYRSQLSNIPELQGSKELYVSLVTGAEPCRSSEQIPLVQGLQGREQQFETQARRLGAAAIDRSRQSQGFQGEFRDFKKIKMPHFKERNVQDHSHSNIIVQNSTTGIDYARAYNMGNPVSLHSTMQTNVPTPFVPSSRGLPTHLHMPAGGNSLRNKYTSGEQIATHGPYIISKSFSSSAQYQSQAADVFPPVVQESPAVEGVQGDGMSCIQFQTWLKNCQRFNVDCSKDIHSLTLGEKNLAAIFEEQSRMIKQIAADYRRVHATSEGKNLNEVSLPHEQDHTFVQGTQQFNAACSVESLLSLENPCPQGVQGHMCSRFKLWLHNCAKYGLGDCDSQLRNLQTGRKTLNDIFEEQDRMIEAIATFYNENTGNKDIVIPEEFKEENLPDCSQLRVWLENCKKYQLSCDKQLKQVQNGEKTLAEVFNDQRVTIQQIARECRLTTGKYNILKAPGIITLVPDTLDGLTLTDLLAMSNPCPVSFEGTGNADRFAVWLDNCYRYNLCVDNHLDRVQQGKLSLVELLNEHDHFIMELTEQKSEQRGAASLAGLTMEDLYQLDNPCPQGIQGDDCDQFKLWLENCAKYGIIEDCESQLQGVQSGRRTLMELFAEQEKQIREYVDKTLDPQKSIASEVEPQAAGWDETLTLKDLQEMAEPCPQGIQGNECDHFKVWLQNCAKYGWYDDCEKQLRGIQTGRKTIAEVFAEQDMIIRRYATADHNSAPERD